MFIRWNCIYRICAWFLFIFIFKEHIMMIWKRRRYLNASFGSSKIFLAALCNHYWPWNKNGEKVEYKTREKERKTRDAPRPKPEKRKKVSLKKLERTQIIRDKGLERVVYDPKSVEKFGGIVQYTWTCFFSLSFKKSCIYAVNVISPYVRVPYFLYKCVKR